MSTKSTGLTYQLRLDRWSSNVLDRVMFEPLVPPSEDENDKSGGDEGSCRGHRVEWFYANTGPCPTYISHANPQVSCYYTNDVSSSRGGPQKHPTYRLWYYSGGDTE